MTILYPDMKKLALEIAAPQQLDRYFAFPTLHILAEEREAGLFAGQCLDLDIWAYSEHPEEPLERVVVRLMEMAVMEFILLYRKGLLGRLYDSEVRDPDRWQLFRDLMNQKRIARLKDSFETLELGKAAQERKKQGHGDRDSVDLSAFNEEQQRKIGEIVQALSEVDSGSVDDLLLRLVDVIVDHARRSNFGLVA